MNKKYEYDFNNETVKEMKLQLNKLKNNIEIIENNQGKFKNDEYEQIKKELKNIKGKINNSKLLQYENKTELTLKDIYIMDDNILVDIYGIRILKELEKYNTNNEELFKDNVMAKIYLNINIHEQIEKAYKYKIIDIPNNLEIPVTTFTNPINLRVMYMKSTISSYLYITEKIIEVGEINE